LCGLENDSDCYERSPEDSKGFRLSQADLGDEILCVGDKQPEVTIVRCMGTLVQRLVTIFIGGG